MKEASYIKRGWRDKKRLHRDDHEGIIKRNDHGTKATLKPTASIFNVMKLYTRGNL